MSYSQKIVTFQGINSSNLVENKTSYKKQRNARQKQIYAKRLILDA